MFEERINIFKDFPKKGVSFKDISEVLKNPSLFHKIIKIFSWKFKEITGNNTCLLAIESRGFLFGAPLALKLKVPLVLARKPGKLPGRVYKAEYKSEYSKSCLEIPHKAFDYHTSVVIIDDVLATGNTASAVEKMIIDDLELSVDGHLFLMELTSLKGRDKLKSSNVFSIMQFDK